MDKIILELTVEEIEILIFIMYIARLSKNYKKIRQLFDEEGLLDPMIDRSDQIQEKLEDAVRFEYLMELLDGSNVFEL